MCHGNGIHGTRAGAANALKLNASVGEQGVQYAPREGAMGAATLQCQVDPGRLGITDVRG